jgi:diaminopimelate decarboxylase
VGQVGQWCRMGKDSRFGVRVNAGSLLETSLTRDRIGVDESGLQAAEREADRWGGILAGLHIYCGTNVKTPGAIIPVLGAFFARAARIQTLEYVNIGGGIGIDYEGRGNEFDYEAFGESVSALAEQLCDALGRRINVFFEPGRCMVAAAGVFVTRITDVKDLGGRTFVTVDGSVAVFPRPLHHPDSPHRVRMISDHFGARKPVTIVGRTTFSRDILAECELPDVKVGDLIAFENAGAYCCSMQSRFLGQKVPLSYFGKP